MENIELLSRIPFFRELDKTDLKNLSSQIEMKVCKNDDIICNMGDLDKSLFIIKKGEVEVFIPQADKNKQLILTKLVEGQYFGELSLFDQKPRSATVRTVIPSEILILKQESILSYINTHPGTAVAMLAVMSERLRQTDEALNSQVSRNVYDEIDEKLKISDRISDKVASFGGSWKFILSFLGFIFLWMILNVCQMFIKPFDNYPFQFLNLVLAVVASLQAPFIMMSQNRQSSKDRLAADIDFQVNRKNELGIEMILQKIEEMKFSHKEQGPGGGDTTANDNQRRNLE